MRTGISTARPRKACLALAAAVGIVVASASAGDFSDAGKLLTIPTSRGVEHLLVVEPGPEGKLRCLPVDATGKPMDRKKFDGAPADDRGLIDVTRCLIVRTTEPQKLEKAIGSHATIEPIEAAPDYYMVFAPNALKAVEIIERLDMRLVDSVIVSTSRPFAYRCESATDEPLFDGLWHLSNSMNPGADIRAEGAWNMGVTGRGVTIGIVDGGFNEAHPDLAENYSIAGSLSFSAVSIHGTGVAGLAGAARNCVGVLGVAYGSAMSKLFYGGSEYEAALALFWANEINDIKCNAWGPLDNGRVTTISDLERIVIEEGVRTGRGGLGEIYVWAAGNGGLFDRVDYDPYASARETIAVGWIGHEDVAATGNEQGAALMVVTHGGGNGASLTTTSSFGDGYTTNFQGSSAAAPLAAGTIALMLEVAPGLTWRDVQHVLVNSARKNDPQSNSWETNGAGHDVSYDYGFGAIDARNAVILAECWTNVGSEQVVEYVDPVNAEIPDNDSLGIRRDLTVSENLRVEHIEVEVDLTHEYRGDLVIVLTSPQGTFSKFTQLRNDPGTDYHNVVFTSVRSWDEHAAGVWRFKIADRAGEDVGHIDSWTLRLFGTEYQPRCEHDANGDGEIDFFDLNVVLDHFGVFDVPNGYCGDIDGDGIVNIEDLIIVLEAWSETCD